MAPPLPKSKSDKRSKVSVEFEHPARGKNHCSECTHWIKPDACKLVQGDVDPGDWCRLYRAATSSR